MGSAGTEQRRRCGRARSGQNREWCRLNRAAAGRLTGTLTQGQISIDVMETPAASSPDGSLLAQRQQALLARLAATPQHAVSLRRNKYAVIRRVTREKQWRVHRAHPWKETKRYPIEEPRERLTKTVSQP